MGKKETWKDIRGYTGLYQVSTRGRIRSLARYVTHKGGYRRIGGKMIKFSKNEYGYVIICLFKNGLQKCCRVARLVAKAFIPNPMRLPEVNHKNGIKEDNRASQLEWTNRKRNVQHAWDIGLHPRKYNKKTSEDKV
jgi:hypothetical protein